MQRIPQLNPKEAQGEQKEVFDNLQKNMGGVLNIFKTMGHSPAAINSYLATGQALSNGVLAAPLREQIAIIVAEENSCEYCLSAHTYIGKSLGLDQDTLLAAREAQAPSTKDQAALQAARQIVNKRGNLSDDDIANARQAGITDAELIEIVAVVAHNIFTNYFNHIANTEVDLPKVTPRSLAANA